jgi:glycosyltransferase involved in cell wall biosynthesis
MKGGAGTHIRGTIRGFEENGHQVLPLILGDMLNINMHDNQMAEKHLISTRSNSFKNLLPKFIRILFRDINTSIQSRKFAKRIISDAVHFNPDIIYERSCMFSNAGNYVSKNTNIPIFIETSGCLVEIFKESYGTTSVKAANMFEEYKLKNANVVVTEAESAIPYIKKKFNLKTNRIIAKPLGIEPPKHNDESNKINNEVLTVGYVGTFATYHNVELLLPVFNYFKNRRIHFYLIGSGGNYEHIKSWIFENDIENVKLTGYINKHELDSHLKRLDIGLVPNCEKHMSPIKTFEYGLYNICPMVPEYKAFEELIFPNENGMMFKPSSSESIIENLEKALNGQIYYKKCALNWHVYVINNYQWPQVVKEVLKEAETI